MPRFVAAIVLFYLGLVQGTYAWSQEYPSRPVRIVTGPPGGGQDMTARLLATGLTGNLSQPVIVDNRTVVTAPEIVSKSAPDGYSLFLGGGSFMIGHLLQARPYDPVRDFAPIAVLTSAPSVFVVHPSLPVKSIRELIALAKARPGALNYAAAGEASSSRLAAELFKSMAGVDIVWINYTGTGPAITATIGGEAQLLITGAGSLMPHVKSGRLRALGITSAGPSALFPGVATVAGSGLPGYEALSLDAIFAPANTSAGTIRLLNQEIARTLHRADLKQKFFDSGVEVVASSPEDLAKRLVSEIAVWGKVIRGLALRP